MPVPSSLAGTDLTADAMTYAWPLIANKTSDQSVTSSTALVNDTALVVTLAASQTYLITMEVFWLPINNSTTPGLKFGWSIPSGSTYTYRLSYMNQAGSAALTSVATTGASATLPGPALAVYAPFSVVGTIVMSTTPGNFQYQFAQANTSATSTTIKAGSILIAERTA